MFSWSTAGESHGQALVALVEGVPAGVSITSEDIRAALARRRLGYGRGARQKFEQDELSVLSGIRHGRTLGSPIAMVIGNSEWPKWEAVMAVDPVPPEALRKDAGKGDSQEIARNHKLTKPRPGHADLTGMNKFGFTDARNVLERASARETAARVAAGEVARQLLQQVAGIEIISHVISIGEAADDSGILPGPSDAAALDASPVRCLQEPAAQAMMTALDAAKKDGDTLGGVVEVIAYGVPQGLGSYTTPYGRLDASLAQAMMSIQAVKGVEIGDGFATARRRGSQAHDEIVREAGHTHRVTNRAGGIEGGMSNGEALRIRLAFKPISTVPRSLRTIDTQTGEAASALHQRSDTSAVVPGAVIGEAMAALTLAGALTEKLGGDSAAEMKRNLHGFLQSIPEVRK
ncbi:chorismate synthase [Actinobaculum suis]|uniref:Chorismate synthase n=1 Tax=Actinobaculum suis TaxID=1657 RepID=A0A1G7C2Z3_9ACTO|nr:chorismate synthase [Actinobaculum suis]MDY5153141.1 chorismate synthase [Actinobaculum suis]SDE33677.1 chorismate synthase [Actinobaculum suis]